MFHDNIRVQQTIRRIRITLGKVSPYLANNLQAVHYHESREIYGYRWIGPDE